MITELDPRLLAWASVIETDTVQQALKTSRLQIVAHHVALMPDAHVGIGSTVGSVIPTRGAVIPAAVGVDIGCGMVAAETDLRAEDLPDSLDAFLKQVPREIPAGVGQGHRRIRPSAAKWYEDNPCPAELSDRGRETALTQFGSLGSGNHFFEICLDERDVVWLVLHSGSRGIGNQLARQHIDKAKLLARENATPLEDPDLAFFLEGTPEFRAYIDAMLWAQRYASANRAEMVTNVSFAFLRYIGKGGVVRTINCHHNYTEQEMHFGEMLWITRKGAIRAGVDDYGVIPGSMGAQSFIVRGLGNPKSYQSASHGAGRRLSRTKAKAAITIEELTRQMEGKAWLQADASALLDEAPGAYKDIGTVMADQADLVEIQHELRQVLNYKGVK